MHLQHRDELVLLAQRQNILYRRLIVLCPLATVREHDPHRIRTRRRYGRDRCGKVVLVPRMRMVDPSHYERLAARLIQGRTADIEAGSRCMSGSAAAAA
ncbi:hypothetical protein D3C84_1067190 [compost metagenome]